MDAEDVRTILIETPVHGRVLVREAAAARGVLLGFHGYGEGAEDQMSRLEAIPGSAAWTTVSVQGLNRFYRGRSQEIVAGWMTRQDREAAIEDNIRYVDRVAAEVAAAAKRIVCIGFSQGVATAFRAAARGGFRVHAVVAVGGDVPPELLGDTSLTFPRVLLARGASDEWYSNEKLQADVEALRARGTSVDAFTYPGGHEWTPGVAGRAGEFIGALP